jgi:glycosyltransferase involved in cell wall biosynthesis
VRIVLVTQMWPSPAAPEVGSFLVPLVRGLEAEGHEVEVVAIGPRRRGRTEHLWLAADAVRAGRRRRPDVVFAHFLFPAGAAGLAAARAAGAPLVVMAHGQDVANCARPALRLLTRPVVRGAAAVIANSRWLARRLAGQFPGLEPDVCDLGVDLAQFDPGTPAAEGLDGEHPRFLCVGALSERKNVVGLADAFARLGRGSLTFVGDGPLRGALEGRPGVRLAGRVAHAEMPRWLAACDVLCQPSLAEPFGIATLEALAMERTVVATTEGGPPEFVTPEAGVLVDPRDGAALTAALERAAAMPSPNPAARAAAAEHDAARQARRMAAVLERAVRGATRSRRRP